MDTRLLEALRQSDERTREERAARLQWLAKFSMPSAVSGRVELLELLEEARACFINGHHTAVLIVATSAIEQILAEVQQDRRGKPSLELRIQWAREEGKLPEQLLTDADKLRLIRNPFTHAKPEGHEHTLTERFRQQHRHPRSIQEEDSALAVKTMLGIFRRCLEPAGDLP